MNDLIEIAKEVIENHYQKGRHSTGAAMRTKSGKVYTGISINAQKLHLCSEWGALHQAFLAGESEIEMIVAVHRTCEGDFEIYSPCGLCRELFITYCPDAEVILSDKTSVRAKDLLPNAWQKK
ncbi:MAG: cytidine deaminase [Patescibacteria group bacterium]|nr:cytidine deaminase [Patescibacteria group bacterium]